MRRAVIDFEWPGPEPEEAYAAIKGLSPDPDKTILRCRGCRAEFPLRFTEPSYTEILEPLRKALDELSEGRNRECHPLCAFGGKDADLDAEGCTGIDAFIGEEGEYLLITVSGHKTVVDSECLDLGESWVCEKCKAEGCHRPEVCPKCGSKKIGHTGYSERMRASFDDQARELVCGAGYPAEYTGDDWCVSFHVVVKQPILRKDDTAGSVDGLAPTGEFDFEATAAEIVKQARHELKPFEKEMASLDKAMNELYEQINSECTEP
jgi:hypothetical protein